MVISLVVGLALIALAFSVANAVGVLPAWPSILVITLALIILAST